MSARTTFDAVVPVRDELYKELLERVCPFAHYAGLVIRSEQVRLTTGGAAVLDQLEPFLVRREDVKSWPGTLLIGTRVSRRDLFALTPESIDVLKSAASELSAWVNPDLPEDLHLLREDGTTVLGSVAQHEDAWLELDDWESRDFDATASDALHKAFVARP
ncbi:hypothetical protein [Demequina sp.]|uniref:hypothetical protein n=1 Tax=Demequina sp. TaxID=2050685 RepID=UPI0025BE97C9|nr:hypothetical protein [Demequina sp.]